MEGELTYYCKLFYDQMLKFFKQQDRFKFLLEHELPYTGQTNIGELDEIFNCHDIIKKAYARAEATKAALLETEKILIKIMDYFEIPPDKQLMCEVPGEVELLVFRKENNRFYCFKNRDLAPLEPDPNLIVLRMSNGVASDDDEDEFTIPWCESFRTVSTQGTDGQE